MNGDIPSDLGSDPAHQFGVINIFVLLVACSMVFAHFGHNISNDHNHVL